MICSRKQKTRADSVSAQQIHQEKFSIVLGKYAVFYYFENVVIVLRPCLSQQIGICWPLVQLCHLKTVLFLSIASGAKPSYRSLLKTNVKYLKVFVQFNVLKISPGRTTLTQSGTGSSSTRKCYRKWDDGLMVLFTEWLKKNLPLFPQHQILDRNPQHTKDTFAVVCSKCNALWQQQHLTETLCGTYMIPSRN